jgi:phenylpyruvate tautomerase PptA (4-oxalocrotonate tautomerase family)
MEPNEEMVLVSRASLEQLQRQIDGLPDIFAKTTQEIGRALAARLSRALDDLAAQLTETTDDALRSIRDAIPVVIAQHAPEIAPGALDAITEAIYARAAERFATLHAAQRILSERLQEPPASYSGTASSTDCAKSMERSARCRFPALMKQRAALR